MPSWLLNGVAPPSVFYNNPAFTTMLQTVKPASTGVLSVLDLTGGKDIAELSSAMVLTNVLSKLRISSHRTLAVIKIVGPCLILLGGAYEFARNLAFIPAGLGWIADKFTSHFSASIVVSAEAALNDDVCSWVAVHGSAKSAKSLTVHPGKAMQWHDLARQDTKASWTGKPKEPLSYIASMGQQTFSFNGYRMVLDRSHAKNKDGEVIRNQEFDDEPTKEVNITISCFPTLRGTAPIKEFLDHVRGYATTPSGSFTEVFRPWKDHKDKWHWARHERPCRKLDGILMEKALKDSLVSDIDFYLSAACRKFYENRGIPHRRGFLCYGPPGTGKTSFAVAIASRFSLPVYILNLNGMDDAGLESLCGQMDLRCIWLIEDVDCAGLGRDEGKIVEKAAADNDSDGAKDKKKSKKRKSVPVTLSTLLNMIDGADAPEGRLLLMSSNTPDSLDPALVRPGRCDRKVLFGYIGPEVSAMMFSKMYTKTEDELYNGEENNAEIPALAEQFAAKIPTGAAITPAECQAYLLGNRMDPIAAIDGAEAWANEIIDNKLRGVNVSSFANEMDRVPVAESSDSDSECSDDDSPPPSPTGSDCSYASEASLEALWAKVALANAC